MFEILHIIWGALICTSIGICGYITSEYALHQCDHAHNILIMYICGTLNGFIVFTMMNIVARYDRNNRDLLPKVIHVFSASCIGSGICMYYFIMCFYGHNDCDEIYYYAVMIYSIVSLSYVGVAITCTIITALCCIPYRLCRKTGAVPNFINPENISHDEPFFDSDSVMLTA
jgi:lipid-A-disaccharide synthase-like uncharacterized protein